MKVLVLIPRLSQGDFSLAQLRQFKRMQDDFVKAGAVILGISTNSKFVRSACREHLDLPFPLLSDFDGRVSKAYGVLGGHEG